MKRFLYMLQFFTRIPVPIQAQPEDFGSGIKYFPLVGLVIGGLNVLGYLLLSLVFHKILAVILLCLLNLLITGALHLDGLADTCDGIFSSRSREKMLEIMRDSRIGTNGVIAIFFDLILRIALLMQIQDALILKAILIMPVIGRTAMTFLIGSSPPARSGKGLGNLFLAKTHWIEIVIAAFTTLIITAFLLRYQALWVIGWNGLAIMIYRWLMMTKLGGMTGDTLGAGNELSEIVVLLTMGWG
jgi:adenosylcobinamide-GDP ribazoletransferase